MPENKKVCTNVSEGSFSAFVQKWRYTYFNCVALLDNVFVLGKGFYSLKQKMSAWLDTSSYVNVGVMLWLL